MFAAFLLVLLASDPAVQIVPSCHFLSLIHISVGVGKVSLALAHDLIQGRLGDVHIALADQRRREAVEHGAVSYTHLDVYKRQCWC